MACVGKAVHYRLGGKCHAAIVVDVRKNTAVYDLRVFFRTTHTISVDRRPTDVKFGRGEGQWHDLTICDE